MLKYVKKRPSAIQKNYLPYISGNDWETKVAINPKVMGFSEKKVPRIQPARFMF